MSPVQIHAALDVEQIARVETCAAGGAEAGVVRVPNDALDAIATVGRTQIELAGLIGAELRAHGCRGILRFDIQERLEAVRKQGANRLIGVGLAQIAEAMVLTPTIRAEAIHRGPTD